MKTTVLFFVLALVSSTAFGQDSPQNRRDKIENLKIAFITSELDLTNEEAEKFWPIYNEMEQKLRKNRKERKRLNDDIKANYETYSEIELKNKLNEVFTTETEETSIKKEYTRKIAEVIGYKKATKLLSLEQRFKRELLNRVNKPAPPQAPQK